jgi:hypothetical protein
VQGVRFFGSAECRPCYWMNQAIGPGAEEFLRGQGGLRARILTDGILRSTAFAGSPQHDRVAQASGARRRLHLR